MDGIRFVYNKPMIIVSHNDRNALVIGDVHIGIERKLKKKGLEVDNLTGRMTSDILDTAAEFNVNEIIILGDIKESILYPERYERFQIEKFLKELSIYNLILLSGNHDSHINEIAKIKLETEYVFGNNVFLHGNRWPSEKSMMSDFIFIGHNHMAVSIKENGYVVYNDKVWLKAKLSIKNAHLRYKKFNKKIEMIAVPAFNPFITGFNILQDKEPISPIIKNGIFDYQNGNIYTLNGDILGSIKKLKKKQITQT